MVLLLALELRVKGRLCGLSSQQCSRLSRLAWSVEQQAKASSLTEPHGIRASTQDSASQSDADLAHASLAPVAFNQSIDQSITHFQHCAGCGLAQDQTLRLRSCPL